MCFIFLQKFIFFKAEKVDLIHTQNENNLHSISRYMLFWCPPILLAASQSYLPESDNFTSVIRRDERPCCPLTSMRPSGLCLHRFGKKKDFMLVLCKMMTKPMAFMLYTVSEIYAIHSCLNSNIFQKHCVSIFMIYNF